MSFLYDIGNIKLCFIHIPKTGGKSVADSLRGYNSYRDLPHERPHKDFIKHLTLNETHNLSITHNINIDLYFSIIRNPWERAVSFFNYICKSDPEESGFQDLSTEIKSGNVSFTDFIRHMVASNDNVFRPQSEYIKSQGNSYDTIVINLENLELGINQMISNISSITEPVKMSHINKSTPQDFRNYFKTKETIDFVYRYEREIIEEYNFNFYS